MVSAPASDAADVQAQEHAEAIQAAEAQLQSASDTVTELRGQLAALSTDLRGQLAAKGADLEELRATNSSLDQQLADVEAHRRQAETQAGAEAVG